MDACQKILIDNKSSLMVEFVQMIILNYQSYIIDAKYMHGVKKTCGIDARNYQEIQEASKNVCIERM